MEGGRSCYLIHLLMVALRYFLPLLLLWGSPSGAGELWEHLSAGGKRPEARGMEVRWSEDQASLQLKVQHGPEVCRGVTWVSVPGS